MKNILNILGRSMGCIGAFSLVAILVAMGFSTFLWGQSHGAMLGEAGTGFLLFAIGSCGTWLSLYLCSEVYNTKTSAQILSGIAVILSVVLFLTAPSLSRLISPEYLIVFRVYAISIAVGAIAFYIKPVLQPE